MKFTEGIAAGLGAALGATLRYLAIGLFAGLWPLIIINVLGSFLMGRTRPGVFWGKGVLGGFTSFSAYALVVADPAGEIFVRCAYAAGTIVLCIVAWLLGDQLFRRAHRNMTDNDSSPLIATEADLLEEELEEEERA